MSKTNCNCMQACLAYLFNVGIDEVPECEIDGESAVEVVEWLAGMDLAFAMSVHVLIVAADPLNIVGFVNDGYNTMHAVVCHNNDVVFNPHTHLKASCADVRYGGFLVPLHPPRFILPKPENLAKD